MKNRQGEAASTSSVCVSVCVCVCVRVRVYVRVCKVVRVCRVVPFLCGLRVAQWASPTVFPFYFSVSLSTGRVCAKVF